MDLKIEQIKIEDLKPAEYNPRHLTKKQADDLALSMKRFGLVDPIIVNRHPGRENVVIGGHQRLKIAEKIGITVVPVVYVEFDEKQEKELNLRLNKNTGEWDFDLLANFESDLLADIGWEQEEIDEMFQMDLVELSKPEAKLDIGNKKNIEIKPVFYVSQIEILEAAILKTGEKNRNQAFMEICQFYLDNKTR